MSSPNLPCVWLIIVACLEYAYHEENILQLEIELKKEGGKLWTKEPHQVSQRENRENKQRKYVPFQEDEEIQRGKRGCH